MFVFIRNESLILIILKILIIINSHIYYMNYELNLCCYIVLTEVLNNISSISFINLLQLYQIKGLDPPGVRLGSEHS